MKTLKKDVIAILNEAKAVRDIELAAGKEDNKRKIKGMAINDGMRFLATFIERYEKEDDEVELPVLLKAIAVKKTNHSILSDVFLNLEEESFMDIELEALETLEDIEKKLDKFLK